MRKLLVATLLLAVSSSAFAQHVQLPMRTDRSTIQRVYATLVGTTAERKEIYAALSVDQQSDLWMLQLEEFLAANPRLDLQQRDIAMEMVGLVASGVLQRQASPSTEEATRANAQIERFGERASLAFSEKGQFVFTDLGPNAVSIAIAALDRGDEEKPAGPRLARTQSARQLAAEGIFDCNCNTTYDTCGLDDCVFHPQACTRKPAGCGPMWAWGCNGWCNI